MLKIRWLKVAGRYRADHGADSGQEGTPARGSAAGMYALSKDGGPAGPRSRSAPFGGFRMPARRGGGVKMGCGWCRWVGGCWTHNSANACVRRTCVETEQVTRCYRYADRRKAWDRTFG